VKRAQASLEYLLLTAGVILVGVIASQVVVTTSTGTSHQISTELNVANPVDKTPPTTTPLCDGTTCYSQYNTSVNLGFLCQDNLGGSGCARTYYAITRTVGSTTTNYASGSCDQNAGKCSDVVKLQAPPAGQVYEYQISYFSVDHNGNKETPRTATIYIGKAAPKKLLGTSCSISFTPLFPRPGEALDINVIASDVLYDGKIHVYSPAAGLDKNISCGTGTSCSGAVLLPKTPSAYTVTIEVLGKDKFGNSGICGEEDVNVDGKQPTVTFNSPNVCEWQNKDFTVSVTGSDPTPSSGLGAWKYTIEDGIPPEYTSKLQTISGGPTSATESFTVTVGSGKACERQDINACEVTTEFFDRAGNSVSKSEKFSVDYNAPTIGIDIPSAGWVNGQITVIFSCTDNLSGCHYVHYELTDAYHPANNKSGNIYYSNNTGCPPTGSKSATAKLTITCPAGETCAYTLKAYNVDYAGNESPVKTWSSNSQGPGAYLIDSQDPHVSYGIYKSSAIEHPILRDYSSNDWYTTVYGDLKAIGIYQIDESQTVLDIRYSDSGGSGVTTLRINTKIEAYETSDGLSIKCYDGPYNDDGSAPGKILSQGMSSGGRGYYAYDIRVQRKPGSTKTYAIHCVVSMPDGEAGAYQLVAVDWVENETKNPDCTYTVSGYCLAGGVTWIYDTSEPAINTDKIQLSGDAANPSCGWYKSATLSVPVYDPSMPNKYASSVISDTGVDRTDVSITYNKDLEITGTFDGETMSSSTYTQSGSEYFLLSYSKPSPQIGPGLGTLEIKIETKGQTSQYFGNGNGVIYVAAVDGVGHIANAYLTDYKQFGIDSKPPTITGSVGAQRICSNKQTSVTVDAQDNESGIYKIEILASNGSTTKTLESKTYPCETKSTTLTATVTYAKMKELFGNGLGSFTFTAKVTDNAGNVTEKSLGDVKIISACTSECTDAKWLDDCTGKSGWYAAGESKYTRTDCNPNVSSCTAPSCGPEVIWKKYEKREYGCSLDDAGNPTCTYDVTDTTWLYDGTKSNPCSNQSEYCTCTGSQIECSYPSDVSSISMCKDYQCVTATQPNDSYDCTSYNARICDGSTGSAQDYYITISCTCSSSACSCTGKKYQCPSSAPTCVNGQCIKAV